MQARAALAAGRHAEALAAVRRARRVRGGTEAPILALAEGDALFGLLRYREAVGVATRALDRRPSDKDVEARLRTQRGHLLWLTGQVERGVAEVARASSLATSPLTRARVQECLALFAWKRLDLDEAGRHLETARGIYASCDARLGIVRVYEKESGVLQDAGYVEEALHVVERRIELASTTTRADAVALAHSDRGCLLTIMGRWDEAARDLDLAGRLFGEIADPRERTVVAVGRAALDLARGELAGARAALEHARAAHASEPDDPRALAEVLLLGSDIALAADDLEAAERLGAEALGIFGMVKDRTGECRSRVRRAHALISLGRPAEAVREGQRAVDAAASRSGLAALAHLALGRALLRSRPLDAVASFDRVLALAAERPELAHSARLGRTIAKGVRREDEEVGCAVASLEAWDDRRLLSHCLADIRALLKQTSPYAVSDASARTPAGSAPDVPLFMEAVAALGGEGEWAARWAGAMRAVRPILPWRRAVLAGEPGWECGPGAAAAPTPLPSSDLAIELSARAIGPAVYDLIRDEALRRHHTRALHGLGAAVIAPVVPGTVLYVDFVEGAEPPGQRELALVGALARLVAMHLPEPAPPEEPPAAFPGIVGRCDAMQALYRSMAAVAPSDVTVHIFGETGTGKEKVARALHERSRRARGPFVAINASSYSDEMFQDELFGHTRGAFTGAINARDGLVAAAEGGTLFIDEVIDLTVVAQARLLRLLQEREYRRVGENDIRRANVRILTASNVTLEERVAAGLFRSDLLYRLNVEVLNLPALRDRGEDVLALARHFVALAAARECVPTPAVASAVARAVVAYSWPGNIRELESQMSRLVRRAGKGPIRPEHLSAELKSPPARLRSSLKEAALVHERGHVAEALTRNGGNRARTALDLGLTRQALVVKIRRLGL